MVHQDVMGNGGEGKEGNERGRRRWGGGGDHSNHLSLTKLVGINNNIQPMMKDAGNNANAPSGSGGCIEVAVAVARRMVRVVLRAEEGAVAKKQQSTNDGGLRQ